MIRSIKHQISKFVIQMQSNFTLIIGQQFFSLTSQEISCMTRISQQSDLQQQEKTLKIQDCEVIILQIMRYVMKIANYQFVEYKHIDTSDLSKVITTEVAEYLAKVDMQALNSLYKLALILGCEGIRRYIVATIACRIYFQPKLGAYEAKREQIKRVGNISDKKDQNKSKNSVK